LAGIGLGVIGMPVWLPKGKGTERTALDFMIRAYVLYNDMLWRIICPKHK
jgi:hypothetical protein